MVARDLLEWLPAGWTMQFRMQKTGRKVRYYMNLETGQKFFSKDDLVRYTKMESPRCTEPQPTNGHNKSHSKVNHMQHVVKTNEHPEWLPDGWIVELKTRNSGPKIGNQYKCYVDPLTGCRFYSKPEVFRYLKSVKRKSCASERKKTGISMHSDSKVLVEKSAADDLPPGWIREIKIRKNTCGIKKDPYYTDPVSGYVFRSKKDVFRYLETGEISRHAFLPMKRCINDLKSVDGETLPSSAAKRQKLKHPATQRQLFAGRASSDMSSFAPPQAEASKNGRGNELSAETGCAVAPTAEILQKKHLMDNVIGKGADTKENYSISRSAQPKPEGSKSNQAKRVSADGGPVSVPAADILQEKNSLESGMEKSSSRKTLNNLSKLEDKKKLNVPRRSSKRLAGLEPELVAYSVSSERALKTENTKACRSEVILAEGLTPDSLVHEASQQLDVGLKSELVHHASTSINIPSHGALNKSEKPIEDQTVPREQPGKVETEENNSENPQLFFPFGDSCSDLCRKTLTDAIPDDTADKGFVSTPAADILQEKNLLECRMEKSSNRKTWINSSKSKNRKQLNMPLRSSKRLAGLEPELAANSLSSERSLKIAAGQSSKKESILDVRSDPNSLVDGTFQQVKARLEIGLAHHDSRDIKSLLHKESTNKNKKPLEDRTVLEEHPQKLDNGNMFNEKPDPQLFLPIVDILSDPCVEFAFKTLTGAIPIEDNLVIQDYFQQQLDTSRIQRDGSSALPDFGIPSCFQNDISSHFDAPEKQSASQQQLPPNPLFPPPGNASLPSCNGIGSQQPCLQGNTEVHGKVNS